MTPELSLHPDARREFDDAADYYEHEHQGLGTLFVDEVAAGFARIREHPGAALEIAPGTRKLVLARFPYSLIYQTRGGCVRVLAVAHQRKRPHYWRGRT